MLLALVVTIAFSAVVAYKIIGGELFKPRGIVALAFVLVGFQAFYSGFNIARMEDERARHGRVTQGIVVQKLDWLQSDRYIPEYQPAHHRLHFLQTVVGAGTMLHQQLSRLIATRSLRPLTIVYRYPCDGCRGHDFVTEAMWSQLQVGQAVNVVKIDDEPGSGRLEENPQWTMALIELGIGVLLLFGARLVSGVPLRHRDWITAPAVVLRVEPVTYPDATRWRIHFAYFDPDGQAQESADEVTTETWKAGDDCIAVFRPKTPDLATLRPVT